MACNYAVLRNAALLTQRTKIGRLNVVIEIEAEASPQKQPFRILAVCTGNVCRSPLAERLLVSKLAELANGAIVVASAGTQAVVGSEIDPRVSREMKRLGIDSGGFKAAQVTAEHIRRADLILTMTRDHRGQLMSIEPSGLRKTFTIRELVRILANAPADLYDHSVPERLRLLTKWALRARSAPADPSSDDVIDPFRREEDVYLQMFSELLPTIHHLLAHLTEQPGPWPGEHAELAHRS